jgi:hypothetical protein
MRILLAAGLAAVVAVGTACGGSNPGSGSGTLYVKAQLEADGTPDGNWIAVQVRQGHPDAPIVNDAVVTLRGDQSGEMTLPWQGVTFGGWAAGWYGTNNLTWDTGFALRVQRQSDNLEAYLQVPGLTVVTQPVYNTTFSVADGRPLLVKWEDAKGRRAEIVTVRLDRSGFRRELPMGEDPLQLSIELSNVVSGDERVTVTRMNDVNLAGGTPGSVFSATTHHDVPFVVQ